MAYVKKYATEEERRKAKSEAGKKGAAKRIANGNNRGGRPRLAPGIIPKKSIPVRTLTVRQPDYEVYVKCANAADLPIIEFVHLVAEKLKEKNPTVFKVDDIQI